MKLPNDAPKYSRLELLVNTAVAVFNATVDTLKQLLVIALSSGFSGALVYGFSYLVAYYTGWSLLLNALAAVGSWTAMASLMAVGGVAVLMPTIFLLNLVSRLYQYDADGLFQRLKPLLFPYLAAIVGALAFGLPVEACLLLILPWMSQGTSFGTMLRVARDSLFIYGFFYFLEVSGPIAAAVASIGSWTTVLSGALLAGFLMGGALQALYNLFNYFNLANEPLTEHILASLGAACGLIGGAALLGLTLEPFIALSLVGAQAHLALGFVKQIFREALYQPSSAETERANHSRMPMSSSSSSSSSKWGRQDDDAGEENFTASSSSRKHFTRSTSSTSQTFFSKSEPVEGREFDLDRDCVLR